MAPSSHLKMSYGLGFAGVLPFAAASLAVWAPANWLDPAIGASLTQWQLGYGAVILSFMAGARWGLAIHTGITARLIPAVIPALLGWVCLVPAALLDVSVGARLLGLAIAFGGLALTEWRSGEWAPWYTSLRIKLSLSVILCLLISAAGS